MNIELKCEHCAWTESFARSAEPESVLNEAWHIGIQHASSCEGPVKTFVDGKLRTTVESTRQGSTPNLR